MATEIRAIPTLRGEAARRFIERAEAAERSFKGFGSMEKSPEHQSMLNILRKSGML